MKRILVLMTVAVISALLLAACASPAETNSNANTGANPAPVGGVTTTGNRDSLPYSVVYGGSTNGGQSGIWVNGTGSVTAVPDLAILSLGVEAQAKTVADANSQAATAMDAIKKVLLAKGIAEKDIKTQYFSIYPIYQWLDRTQEQIITGYRVSNSVTARIRDLDKVGAIIDEAAAAGGDLTRINGISFTVEDPTAFNNQAREKAMQEAIAKAKQMAQLAGVPLGKPVYIAESGGYAPYPYAMPAAAKLEDGRGVSTPVSPGEVEISISVQIVYAIE